MGRKRNPFRAAAAMLRPEHSAEVYLDPQLMYSCCCVARVAGLSIDMPPDWSKLMCRYADALGVAGGNHFDSYGERLIALGFAAAMYETGDL